MGRNYDCGIALRPKQMQQMLTAHVADFCEGEIVYG